ncbi:hypothetical protein [Phenylobacterium montanum]|uniref:Uncharacterized protein n=1 Tax=Phenylobacterium montanum TaxID=2823693 RepID=A0A975FYC3_9CAUL|nr:hypothetical protein [Caulobacter sp. S6]QUD87680.1 hypothetical protein KCG34_21960 [Caulobacter sp. S6]
MTKAQADALSLITPSGGRAGEPLYFPSRVRLKSGTNIECVYLSEAITWFRWWGVWPEDDRGKSVVSLAEIDALSESPHRLPASFANQLYEAGETGMGYTVFTVKFHDGTSCAFGNGNAIDFIHYPAGKSARDVAAVTPHVPAGGRNMNPVPDYSWCLYSVE